MAASLGLARDAERLRTWERAGSLAIGAGVAAGALWWLRRSTGTRLVIDRGRRRIQVIRTGMGGRRVAEVAFDELAKVGIEQGEDSDGGLVTRPIAHLKSGDTLHLSELWSHDHRGVTSAVWEIARACDLPDPT